MKSYWINWSCWIQKNKLTLFISRICVDQPSYFCQTECQFSFHPFHQFKDLLKKSIWYLLHFDVVISKDLLPSEYFGPEREEKSIRFLFSLNFRSLLPSPGQHNLLRAENGCLLGHKVKLFWDIIMGILKDFKRTKQSILYLNLQFVSICSIVIWQTNHPVQMIVIPYTSAIWCSLFLILCFHMLICRAHTEADRWRDGRKRRRDREGKI